MELLFAESSTKAWGTEQHFAALAIAMAQRGHGVQCLMRPGSPLEPLLRAANVPVTLSTMRGVIDPRMLSALGRLVKHRRPDWLVTNDGRFYWPFVLLARISHARAALFRHWPNMPKSAVTRRLIPRLADRFILVSQFQREFLRRSGIRVDRMPVLYNPVDTQKFSPSDEARARGRSLIGAAADEIVVGYVGRMIADKGVFTLASAAPEVLKHAARVRFVWVGDGSGLEELRGRVAASADHARHTFLKWHADMRAIYTALDLIVVPSEYPDPCPRVPVEAQACAVPVVCSDAGGLPETMSPGVSGVLTPEGDARSLAAAILELAADPERRAQMGMAGRQFACERFSFERVAQDFEAMLLPTRARPLPEKARLPDAQ